METPKTNKNQLYKGIKDLIPVVLLMFIAPVLFHVAILNQGSQLFIPLLILAIILAFFAVFLLYKGLKTIVNSLFNNSN